MAKKKNKLLLGAALLVSFAWATPALAATTTRVIITQDQQEVPESRIQLFSVETGAEVQRQDDEDEPGALFLLDRGRYRVVVDGREVREIGVSGTGSRTFNISLPPGFPTAAPPAEQQQAGDATQIVYDFVVARSRRPHLSLYAGAGEARLPRVGTGVARAGPPGQAPEEFAGQSPRGVEYFRAGGGFVFPINGVTAGIEASYSWGNDSATFAVPGNSGTDAGIVYGAPAPSGSSGIISGFAGVSGESRVEGSGLNIRTFVTSHFWNDRGLDFGVQPREGSWVDGTLFIEYSRNERDYVSTAGASAQLGTGTSTFLVEFDQDRRQALNENYFTLGIRTDVAVKLVDEVLGRLMAQGGLYYRDTNLRSVERNRNNFSAPQDRDFTIEIRDSDSGWGFRGGAGAAIEFRLSPTVSLSVGGRVDYWSSVGSIFNPSSGDQVFFEGLTTGLATDDAWSAEARAGVTIWFR